jgi:5'-nucleotidase/UDP-sugar diphosphatase
MKYFKKCMILFIILVLPCASFAASGTKELVILHTNDFHGHPIKFFKYPAPNVGGLPAMAAFVDDIRQANKNVLVLDAGDMNTGRPESNFFKAIPDIIGYNYVGYDAMALGNHEFDNPVSLLKQQQRLAKFPFISANIKTNGGGYLVDPYTVKDFDGFKVGIFGLTTKETEIIGNPDYIKDIRFEDEVTAAQKMVAELKGKVDVIIADLIIDGHTHTDLKEPILVNGTPIVQAWQWGLKVGKGKLTLKQGKVSDFAWESVPINLKRRIKKADGSKEYPFIGKEYKEDVFLLSVLTPYADRVESILSEVIGESKGTYFNKNARNQETELGDLVSDAMLWFTKNLKSDFAIQNGGGIRADLPEGKITKKLIYEILPFDNSIMVLKLKGSQVVELFDYVATIPNGKGAFTQVSDGVSFTLNYSTQKCENITINGKPIDPEKVYTIATNSYMASGGDGYKIFKKAMDKYDTSAFQRDAVIEYIIKLGGMLKPQPKERIKLIMGKAEADFIMDLAA